ncbi:MAG: dihydroorotate dehydrogenase electron transfer subunit [Bacillota bacterium]
MQETGIVTENHPVCPSYYRMRIKAPKIAEQAQPGQFVHIRCSRESGLLLRRPISIHQIRKDRQEIAMLFRAVGRGTAALSRFEPGDAVDLLGPLGKGFSIPKKSGNILLVAGGMGIAPFFALAEDVKRTGSKVLLLYGARTGDELSCAGEFTRIGCSIRTATEDGSSGLKGFVTELMVPDLLRIQDYVYLCGPKPMLKKAVAICRNFGLPGEVSLEEHMACGIGACLGCVCRVADADSNRRESRYKKVCTDGPVFSMEEVILGD